MSILTRRMSKQSREKRGIPLYFAGRTANTVKIDKWTKATSFYSFVTKSEAVLDSILP